MPASAGLLQMQLLPGMAEWSVSFVTMFLCRRAAAVRGFFFTSNCGVDGIGAITLMPLCWLVCTLYCKEQCRKFVPASFLQFQV